MKNTLPKSTQQSLAFDPLDPLVPEEGSPIATFAGEGDKPTTLASKRDPEAVLTDVTPE